MFSQPIYVIYLAMLKPFEAPLKFKLILKKFNIEEIAGLVVSLLDNPKSFKNLILQQIRMKA